MYTCINCGGEVEELYRRYSPSVLKVLKCSKCGQLADKYIEYDPVIVLVDLVLLEKPAYRHLLYNSGFKSYWKLLIVLLLSESFRSWSNFKREKININNNSNIETELINKNDGFDDERQFYMQLAHTGLSFGAFLLAVIIGTELRWLFFQEKPHKYKTNDLIRGLIIGGCAKLLGLLDLVWQHVTQDLHHTLIHGYTILCLLTAYSVVCNSGRKGSLIGLSLGLLAYNYTSNITYFPSLLIKNVTIPLKN